MGRKARRQPRGCQRGASKSKVQSSKPSQAIPPWPFDGLSTLDIWAMHLTPARGTERGCGRRPSRSAWQMRKTSEPLHALRLVLRTQPRSDRPTCVKCIALILNAQFSFGPMLCAALLFFGAWHCGAEEPGIRKVTPDELSEMSLDQLIDLKVSTVYGASKHWQEVAQAPSSVSIVTGEEIGL